MPEGHTIHRLARDLTQDFGGKCVQTSSPQGRFAEASSLSGVRFERAHAHGKHLFLDFSSARVHIHLGLFGKFKRQKISNVPRETVRLRITTDARAWDLTGPTACHVLDDASFAALLERLGADPLSSVRRPASTWTRLHGSKRSMGALLLDQSIFAGIGNVYRAELLFLLKMHPDTRGSDIDKKDFEKLWGLSRELLQRGVEKNRIVTVPGGGGRGERLYVYKQGTCRFCGTFIAQTTSAARTLYYCPSCQRPTTRRS